MNYLAHLYMAGNHTELVVGGFLGDFVKGPLKGEYPSRIEKGIELHRRIDSWSDQHPSVKQIRQLLPRQFGRYAGIITDILCDHVLANEWEHFSENSLQKFCDQRLLILESHAEQFPDRARLVLQRMKTGNWLVQYRDLGYSIDALSLIGQRLSRDNPLHLLEQPVSKNYQQLQNLCRQTLKDTIADVAEWRTLNQFSH